MPLDARPSPQEVRPSPQEVRAWLTGAVADAAVVTCVAVLEADPNWRVASTCAPTVWDLHLLYAPAGMRCDVHLERLSPSVWRGIVVL